MKVKKKITRSLPRVLRLLIKDRLLINKKYQRDSNRGSGEFSKCPQVQKMAKQGFLSRLRWNMLVFLKLVKKHHFASPYKVLCDLVMIMDFYQKNCV